MANGRHNKKCIKALENEKVAILDNIDNISAKILNFFGKLYASPPGESELNLSPISIESASRLERSFIEEEIHQTIFQLDKDKAPSPDGLTIVMFQEC